MTIEQYVAVSIENLKRMSRSAAGVSDTSSSAEKPHLAAVGDELRTRVYENYEMALLWALERRNMAFAGGTDLERFIIDVASRVSDGLIGDGQSLFRTWRTKAAIQTPPEKIRGELTAFCHALAHKWTASSPVHLAAELEQQVDGIIHPFADGCGRTAKVLSTVVLARDGYDLPIYNDRTTYYREINGPWKSWLVYYESLFPNAMSP